MSSFCVKCKTKTENINSQQTVNAKNRPVMISNCAVCGTKKYLFLKTSSGAGIVNNAINKLPFEMHLPGHNFTGPGTRLDKRLDENLQPKDWSKPINQVDNAAMKHDICYLTNKESKIRNEVCDKNMINELNLISNPSLREKIESAFVKKILATKVAFGMGF